MRRSKDGRNGLGLGRGGVELVVLLFEDCDVVEREFGLELMLGNMVMGWDKMSWGLELVGDVRGEGVGGIVVEIEKWGRWDEMVWIWGLRVVFLWLWGIGGSIKEMRDFRYCVFLFG